MNVIVDRILGDIDALIHPMIMEFTVFHASNSPEYYAGFDKLPSINPDFLFAQIAFSNLDAHSA